jgi:outer membrane protein assembly factor BamB
LGTGRAVWRLVAAAVVVVADLAVIATAALPWAVEGPAGRVDPFRTVLRIIVEIGAGPGLTALLLPRLWRGAPRRSNPALPPLWIRLAGWAGRDRVPVVLGGRGALLSLLVAGTALVHLDARRGLRPAGPVAVLAGLFALLAWVVLAVLTPGPVRPGRGRVAAAGTAVSVIVIGALVAASVPVTRWYTAGRFLRHDTAAALPDVPDTPPARLDRVRWQARVDAIEQVRPVPAGRYLLAPERYGARALDAVTGSQQWTYLRDDVSRLLTVVASADGRTTVLVYLGLMHEVVVGLETATGALRWEHHLSLGRQLSLDPVTAASGSLVVISWPGAVGADVVALSTSDGRLVWTTSTAEGCVAYDGLAVAGGAVVYAEHCPRLGERAVALSFVDGHRTWTWQPGGAGRYSILSGDGSLRAVPGGLLATYSVEGEAYEHPSAALLDPATGVVRTRYQVPGRWPAANDAPEMQAVQTGDTMLYLGARSTALDPRTGRARWSRALPGLDGWRPIQAVVRGNLAYLLLLEAATDRTPGGELRLVAVRADTGEVAADLGYQRRHCGSDCGPPGRTLLLGGPGVLVVDESAGPLESGVCFLSAVG